METTSLDASQMAMSLFGGLALFLFGLDQLTGALKAVAGARMRDLLASIATNRFKGVLAGGVTTAVVQSSSITTVLAIGFVSAGLLSMPQSIGVIMGAQIGTTVTAQIIAFKVTKYALIAVTVGFVMQFFIKNERVQRYGMIVLGLGLVFFGMNMMSDAMRPLRTYQPFIELMLQMDSRLLAVLLSASFTALIQSSSATTGIIIVMAGQGLIGLEQGIALVFGSNIGTCVTALLASIGKERAAVRTALIHVTFNVLGVVLWFGFIDEVAQAIRWISPAVAELEGSARLAAETPRQIANAHTMFNVGNTLIFIWFASVFAWFVTKLVPDRPLVGVHRIKPIHLDKALLEAPAVALEGVRMELVRVGRLIEPMIEAAPQAVMRGSAADLARVAEMDEDVDTLHGAVIKFLGKLSRGDLTPAESEMLHDYMGIANYLENIGDMVEVDLRHAGTRRLDVGVRISPSTQRVLQELADKVVWALRTTNTAIETKDKQLARSVIDAKPEVSALSDAIADLIAERLIAEEPHRTETFQIESELIEQFKRVFYFCKRISKLIAGVDVLDDVGPEESVATVA